MNQTCVQSNARKPARQRRPSLIAGLLMLAVGLTMAFYLTALAEEVVKGGNLNGKAINLPVPVYPPQAKQSRISGLVVVDVVVNESGKVESAKAAAGPTLLRQAAVDAASRAKFAPTLKGGTPVKVEGNLRYDFKLD